jgi:hypothetical protein
MRHPERSPFAWGELPGIVGENDPSFVEQPMIRPPTPLNLCEGVVSSYLSESFLEEMRELAVMLGYSSGPDLSDQYAV